MTLEVIGTGFGRTGTDSMRSALNILGFGPTHHMFEVVDNPDQTTLWQDLAYGAAPDWDRLFQGYRACVDWPSAHYWRELIEYYPEARVLLTWRSSESWWVSFEKTILQYTNSPDHPEKTFSQQLIGDQVFGGRPVTRDKALAVYEAHVQEVIDTVPDDRLLVYKIGDGWVPLCRHLNVDIPDQEFPNRNNKDDFANRIEIGQGS